jgi:hypothetical protein
MTQGYKARGTERSSERHAFWVRGQQMSMISKIAMMTLLCTTGCALEEQREPAEVSASETLRPDGALTGGSGSSTEITVGQAAALGVASIPVHVQVTTGCTSTGDTAVWAVVYGSSGVNVQDIVLSTVKVAGVASPRFAVGDQNGDGYLDLKMQFSSSQLVLQLGASVVTAGGLTTGSGFSGEATVTLAPGGLLGCKG